MIGRYNRIPLAGVAEGEPMRQRRERGSHQGGVMQGMRCGQGQDAFEGSPGRSCCWSGCWV